MKECSCRIEPLEARIAPAFAAIIELSSLDGILGFKINGAVDTFSGYSVSDAGDVNGDGFDDLLIGAHLTDANGQDNSGASYVVFGKAGGFSPLVNLSALNGASGFKINGEAAAHYAGISVSAAGDVNGDSFDDLLIGANGADDHGFRSGASYVVFGKGGPFAPAFDLSALNGADGFKISGVAARDYTGISVSNAGDVNGDGFDDLLIGAYLADPNGYNRGASYVVFGKSGAFAAKLELSTLNGVNGFQINGVALRDYSGRSVSDAGDVNGDGFDDLLIGAYAADPNGSASGASYVVFGKGSAFSPTLNLSTLNGANGFKISGAAAGDFSGRSVSSAGDLNGDGFDDLLIGAYGADPNGTASGASYVVFGKGSAFSATLNLSTINGVNGFKISGEAAGDNSGHSVSSAGDVNGDGFDDLLIGAYAANPNGYDSGASYVVFGRGGAFSPTLNLSTLNGANGFKISGELSGDNSGRSVSTAGDVNGDSFDDLLIGANGADSNGNLSGASYVIFGRGVELSVSAAAVDEADAGMTALRFTVSLSEAGALPISVKVATSNGSAEANRDYAPLDATTLTFAPGETSKTIDVNVIGDTLFESDETFSIVLSDATGGVIRDGTGLATIRNDDAPPTINIANASVIERDSGTSSLSFTVSLSTPSGLPASIEFATADGTAFAGSDYAALIGALTFAPGETNKTITIDVTGDGNIEEHERFSVLLFGASSATLGNRTATGTILNDDTAIRISDSVAGLERDSGTTAFVFTVDLEKPSTLPVTVNFATTDGTASGGSDYTALAGGTLTFAPGETSKTITVDVAGETTHEADETFSVVLSNATNATLAISTATGMIRNDDAPPLITISDGSIIEGNTGSRSLGFEVSLSAAAGLPVSVEFATANGTALGGSDFVAAESNAEITFAPGETSKTIAIEVIGETSIENHESFSLLLSDSTNAVISGGTATGTIRNDDTAVRITDAALREGHSGTRPMTFTVSLTAASALPVSVDFMSGDETAIAGSDYIALSAGILTFAPGETSQTLTVEIIGETVVEPTETFMVLLSGAANALIDDATGLGTILDDDLTIAGNRKATFTDPEGDLVTIKVSKGTLKVEDFTLFPSGLGSQLALVDLSGETEFSGANLSITARRPAGTTGGSALVHVGHINATGIDLGKVVVRGDLAQIDAGDELTPERGLLSLSAHSLGRFGTATQLPGGSTQSDITGALKTLKLADGMHDAALFTSGDIGKITIKGDMLGSSIRSDGNIRALRIAGDLAAATDHAALISARGALGSTSTAAALAIGSVSIGGSVDHAEILAGYDRTGAAVNADASIGRVVVGRNWIASNLVAGAIAGTDGFFGTDDDAPISSDTPIVARIASILIKGIATGTNGGLDHFGFVAEEIAALKSGGTKLALTKGPGNDVNGRPIGTSDDLKVREVA